MNHLHPHDDGLSAPACELPHADAAKPQEGRGWLTAFAGLQVAIVLGSALLPSRQIEYFTCQLMFAAVLMQSTLVAVWLALGPGPLAQRFIFSPLWLFLTAVLAGVVSRPADAFPILLSIGVTVAVLFSLVFLALRWRMRLDLLRSDEVGVGAAFQFRIIHLFALTIAVSVLLALGRLAVEYRISLRHQELVFPALLGSIWTLSLLPAVFVPLCQNSFGQLSWGLILGFLLTTGTAALGGLLIMQLGPGIRSPREFPYFTVTIPAAAYLLLAGSLHLYRRAGYRLARRAT